MSRKKLPEGKQVPKGSSLNSLIKQLEDPRSLLSFLPEDTRISLLAVPEAYLNIDEHDLLLILENDHNLKPTVMMETLRLNFWMEYDRVWFSKSEDMMNMSNIYLGVCTRSYWHKIMAHQPHVAAFILCRPLAYKATYEALQQLSNRKYAQILSLPIRNTKGELDHKLLEIQMKTAAMVDLRNQGSYLQRSETKNLTMLKQETNHTYSQALSLTIENRTASEIESEIQEKLKMLEEEARMQLPPPAPKFGEASVIDAEYKDVEKRGN